MMAMEMSIPPRFEVIIITIVSAAILASSASIDYCKRKCPCENPTTYTVHLPGPTKNQFYKCNYGIPILMKCGPGTQFDPLNQICNWPTAARAVACSKKPYCYYEGSGSESESQENNQRNK